MPTAKAQFDKFGELRSRKFTKTEWDELHKRVRRELRALYRLDDVDDDPTFGHPADAWASALLEVAETEVSMSLWLHQRLTKEQMRAEQAATLRYVNKAHAALAGMSYDLHNMLDCEVGVLECQDMIGNLIPHIEGSLRKISALPPAKKNAQIQHIAALRMTVAVMRRLEEDGIRVTPTADKERGYISVGVQILKILGDALKLTLDETTWRDLIIEARPMIAVPQSSDAPESGGA